MPMTKKRPPVTSGHLRRRVFVTRKPVDAPMIEDTTDGMMSRSPESVAERRRTPWKNRGLRSDTNISMGSPKKEWTCGLLTYTLNMMALASKAVMEFDKM